MDKEEYEAIIDGLYEAKKTFYNTLSKHGYDGAYYALTLEILMLSEDFKSILETIKYTNLQGDINGKM